MRWTLSVSADARHDIAAVLRYSRAEFGATAAERYQALIGQAFRDLADDPLRPGSKKREELREGLYTLHLEASRDRVSGDRVKRPRHFVMYRIVEARVEVLRLLHDSRDLTKHLPRTARPEG